jgi:REP element-mobilizing transposase RayT
MLQIAFQGGKGDEDMISRTRGYLPHLLSPNATYFLTFRLEDSLPASLLSRWKAELQFAKSRQQDPRKINELDHAYLKRIENYLDTNSGCCWLKDPRIASRVVQALRHDDGQEYYLQTWTIMPNHVHVLFRLPDASKLGSLVQVWKSVTAHHANHHLGRSGRFWQPEYHDRLIRSQRQLEFTIRYILNNPVKAGFCKEFFQWPWSGCSEEIRPLLNRFFSR